MAAATNTMGDGGKKKRRKSKYRRLVMTIKESLDLKKVLKLGSRAS